MKGKCLSYGTDMGGRNGRNRTFTFRIKAERHNLLTTLPYNVSKARLFSLQTHIRPAFRRKIMRA